MNELKNPLGVVSADVTEKSKHVRRRSNNGGKCRFFTIAFKAQIANFAKTNGNNHATARKFGVSEKSVRKWRKLYGADHELTAVRKNNDDDGDDEVNAPSFGYLIRDVLHCETFVPSLFWENLKIKPIAFAFYCAVYQIDCQLQPSNSPGQRSQMIRPSSLPSDIVTVNGSVQSCSSASDVSVRPFDPLFPLSSSVCSSNTVSSLSNDDFFVKKERQDDWAVQSEFTVVVDDKPPPADIGPPDGHSPVLPAITEITGDDRSLQPHHKDGRSLPLLLVKIDEETAVVAATPLAMPDQSSEQLPVERKTAKRRISRQCYSRSLFAVHFRISSGFDNYSAFPLRKQKDPKEPLQKVLLKRASVHDIEATLRAVTDKARRITGDPTDVNYTLIEERRGKRGRRVVDPSKPPFNTPAYWCYKGQKRVFTVFRTDNYVAAQEVRRLDRQRRIPTNFKHKEPFRQRLLRYRQEDKETKGKKATSSADTSQKSVTHSNSSSTDQGSPIDCVANSLPSFQSFPLVFDKNAGQHLTLARLVPQFVYNACGSTPATARSKIAPIDFVLPPGFAPATSALAIGVEKSDRLSSMPYKDATEIVVRLPCRPLTCRLCKEAGLAKTVVGVWGHLDHAREHLFELNRSSAQYRCGDCRRLCSTLSDLRAHFRRDHRRKREVDETDYDDCLAVVAPALNLMIERCFVDKKSSASPASLTSTAQKSSVVKVDPNDIFFPVK